MEGLKYPSVEKVVDLTDLNWARVTKKGRARKYFPCLKIPEDEAKYFFEKVGKSFTPVRYLGKFWKDARKISMVNSTSLFGMHCAKTSDMSSAEVQALHLLRETDDEILDHFLRQEFSDKQQVERRAEELVFRKTVEIVRRNRLAKDTQKRQEAEELAKLVEQPSAACDSPSKHAHVDNETDMESLAGNESDASAYPFSPSSKLKRIGLRPGDVIEYYESNRIFGRQDAHRVSTIIGIDAKGTFPINLESGDPLQKGDRIRRIRKIVRGQLVEDPDAAFRAVDSYSLRTAGTMKNIAAQRMAGQAKQLRQEHETSVEQHWADQSKTPDQDAKEEPTFDARTKPKSTQPSSKDDQTTSSWRKRLSHQIDLEEEQMTKKRRYKPHIQPDQLQVIMKTWSALQNHTKDTNLSLEGASSTLARELCISERRAAAFLQGDPQQWLSQKDLSEILQGVGAWMKGQSVENV